jgi:hypothetical protein
MAFWYPFRSREIAEITSHLSTDETVTLQTMSNEHGKWWGHRVGIFAVCTVLLVNHFVHPFFASLLISVMVSVIVSPILFVMCGGLTKREKIKEFLCSTGYARQAGFTSESLHFNRWWF